MTDGAGGSGWGRKSIDSGPSVIEQQKQSGTQVAAHGSPLLDVESAAARPWSGDPTIDGPSQWTLATSAQIAASNSIAPIRAHLTFHTAIVVATFSSSLSEEHSDGPRAPLDKRMQSPVPTLPQSSDGHLNPQGRFTCAGSSRTLRGRLA
jgi:hypothetical protein